MQAKTIHEEAARLVWEEYSVIPIRPGEKQPAIKWEEFQKRIPTQAEIDDWFSKTNYQLAIVTGNVSRGRFVLDFDGENWDTLFTDFITKFGEFRSTTKVRTGSGKIHLHALCPDMPPSLTKKTRVFEGKGQIELRANRHCSLMPPSKHPSGEQYEYLSDAIIQIDLDGLNKILAWMNEGKAERFENKELVEDVKLTLADQIKLAHYYVEHYSKKDDRNNSGFLLACRLRDSGLEKDEAKLFMSAYHEKVPSIKMKDGLPDPYTFDDALKSLESAYKHPPDPPWIPEGVLDNSEYEVSTLSTPLTGAEAKFIDSIVTATKPKKQGFNFIDLGKLRTFQEAEIEWVWEGILPADGLSLLVAKPKVGKTTFALNLAYAVACGKSFLGRRTKQGKVFYLALEESLTQVKHKTMSWGNGTQNLEFHFGSLPPNPINELSSQIEKEKPVLVIVDTLQKLIRVESLNDYAEVTIALDPLMNMARKYACHICLTHHNKKQETTLEDSILGSVGLQGGVDTTIHLKKYESYRTFSTIQRYGDDTEETVLTMDTSFTLTPGIRREEAEVDEVARLILNALTSGSKDIDEIVEVVGIRKKTCLAALKKLIELGKITRSGTGKRGDPFIYELVGQV